MACTCCCVAQGAGPGLQGGHHGRGALHQEQAGEPLFLHASHGQPTTVHVCCMLLTGMVREWFFVYTLPYKSTEREMQAGMGEVGLRVLAGRALQGRKAGRAEGAARDPADRHARHLAPQGALPSGALAYNPYLKSRNASH